MRERTSLIFRQQDEILRLRSKHPGTSTLSAKDKECLENQLLVQFNQEANGAANNFTADISSRRDLNKDLRVSHSNLAAGEASWIHDREQDATECGSRAIAIRCSGEPTLPERTMDETSNTMVAMDGSGYRDHSNVVHDLLTNVPKAILVGKARQSTPQEKEAEMAPRVAFERRTLVGGRRRPRDLIPAGLRPREDLSTPNRFVARNTSGGARQKSPEQSLDVKRGMKTMGFPTQKTSWTQTTAQQRHGKNATATSSNSSTLVTKSRSSSRCMWDLTEKDGFTQPQGLSSPSPVEVHTYSVTKKKNGQPPISSTCRSFDEENISYGRSKSVSLQFARGGQVFRHPDDQIKGKTRIKSPERNHSFGRFNRRRYFDQHRAGVLATHQRCSGTTRRGRVENLGRAGRTALIRCLYHTKKFLPAIRPVPWDPSSGSRTPWGVWVICNQEQHSYADSGGSLDVNDINNTNADSGLSLDVNDINMDDFNLLKSFRSLITSYFKYEISLSDYLYSPSLFSVCTHFSLSFHLGNLPAGRTWDFRNETFFLFHYAFGTL